MNLGCRAMQRKWQVGSCLLVILVPLWISMFRSTALLPCWQSARHCQPHEKIMFKLARSNVCLRTPQSWNLANIGYSDFISSISVFFSSTWHQSYSQRHQFNKVLKTFNPLCSQFSQETLSWEGMLRNSAFEMQLPRRVLRRESLAGFKSNL